MSGERIDHQLQIAQADQLLSELIAEEAVGIRVRPRRLVKPVIRYDDVDENERTRKLKLERKHKV